MGQQDDSGSGTLKYFGSQLKLLRCRARLSRGGLGERIGYSESTVASVEQGRRMPQRDFIERADEALGADGLLRIGAEHLMRERYPSWFHDFAVLEPDVLSLNSYENHVVPGLLQTAEYAGAVMAGRCPPPEDEEIEQRIAARLDRQALVTRTPRAVLSFVVEEAVLRRPIGGADVMRGQLQHMLHCSAMRHVSLQVMLTRQERHAGLQGPMVLLETAESRNLAYIEGQRGSFLISEPSEVGVLTQRYGIIRAQALSPEESRRLIDDVAGEL